MTRLRVVSVPVSVACVRWCPRASVAPHSDWSETMAAVRERALADLESVLSSVAPISGGRFCLAPFLRRHRPSAAEHECSRLGWSAGVQAARSVLLGQGSDGHSPGGPCPVRVGR